MTRFVRGYLFAILLFCAPSFESRADSTPLGEGCDIATHEIAIGGGSLQYNTVGAGRRILVLHGLFANKEQWNGVLCLLAAVGYAPIAPDLPGFGKSTGFGIQDYRLENQVELLHKLMESIGVEVFDLAGNSMGGAIAALYTRAHPRQVRSLAFLGAPLGIADWNQHLKDAIYQGINPFIPIDVPQFDLELSLLFVNPPAIPDSVKEALVKEYVEHNRHYQQVWDIVNLYDAALRYRTIVRTPTLILWGAQDRIFALDGANRLRSRIPKAMLVKLPNGGHLLQVEQANETAESYIKFLKRVVH